MGAAPGEAGYEGSEGGPVGVAPEGLGAGGLWDRLVQCDAVWANRGVRGVLPPLSPWWCGVLRRWLCGRERTLVARVGRRGGKSTGLGRWCVVNALYGEHAVPEGDLGVCAIVSVQRRDALERLRTCAVLLKALGWTETRYDKGQLYDRQFVARLGYGQTELMIGTKHGTRVIRAYTASIAGVSGFTCIGALCDEVSKWVDVDTHANPASEVLASLRPTMATQPNAKMALISSPWSTLDAHAKAFELGDTEAQIVDYAPTWIANPSLTEHETHILEPDEQSWEREYKAIPMPTTSMMFFDHAAIERACVLG
jgi:hypothetical protein